MPKIFTRFLQAEINGLYAVSFYRAIEKNIELPLEYAEYMETLSIDNITFEDLSELCKTLGCYNPIVEATGFPSFLTLPRRGTHYDEQTGTYSGTGVKELKNTRTLQWNEIEHSSGEINDEATPKDRTGLVEEGATIKGYIPDDVNVFDNEGNIDESKIVYREPTNQAYSYYYKDHEKYLYLASSELVLAILTEEELKQYLQIMQNIRMNNSSWGAFWDLCDFLNISDIIEITEIDSLTYPDIIVIHFFQKTGYIENRVKRISLFRYIIEQKFPQFILLEAT